MRLTLEKILILKSAELFSAVPEEDLAPVAAILDEVDVETGQDVIVEGDIGTAMYIIVEGRVCVHRGDQDLAMLGAREIFGELAALDPEPRSATVTALEQTQLLKLSAAPLLELLGDNPAVMQGILKVLCRRIRRG